MGYLLHCGSLMVARCAGHMIATDVREKHQERCGTCAGVQLATCVYGPSGLNDSSIIPIRKPTSDNHVDEIDINRPAT